MTARQTVVLVLALLLPASSWGQVDDRARVEQARRMEQRLPGSPLDLRLVGFVDRDPAQNCTTTDPTLPCVEEVSYAGPAGAGLIGGLQRSSLLTSPQEALVGRLMLWGLSDLAYRTTRPKTAATVAVDRGLWERGAVRLPAAESLWTRTVGPSRSKVRWWASAAAPESWLWRGMGSQTLCSPLQYQGAHVDGVRTGGATRPGTLVCVDGFVSNFADALFNHFPGQLFRMGRIEGGKRTRRTGAPNHGEQLITEYLFVSGRHNAAPWSTRQLRDGRRQGVFQPWLVADADGRDVGEEYFVDPLKLAQGDAWQEPEAADSETDEVTPAPSWGGGLDLDDLPPTLSRGMERFIDQIGLRILGHATLEFNATHVRTLTALASMRSPPPAVANLDESAALVLGPNAGHRDRAAANPAEPEIEGTGAWSGGRLTGEVAAQVSKLPNDLRWEWIERLLFETSRKPAPGGGANPGVQALFDCPRDACPNLKEKEQKKRQSPRWRAYSAILGEVRGFSQTRPWESDATEPEARAAETRFRDDLHRSLEAFRQASTSEEAQRASAQLLALLAEDRVHPARLLLDHVLVDLSTTLNAGSQWTAEALETEATSVFERVMTEHGYPTLLLEGRGEPANPLAVCSDVTSEEGGLGPLALDLLFKAPARLRKNLVRPADGSGDATSDAEAARASWRVLQEAAAELPFVAIDDPIRNPPQIEPIVLLPPPAEGSDAEQQAIYRARWTVWSGWHLLWGVAEARFSDGTGTSNAAQWPLQYGLVLRSGAFCGNTTLVAADLEPTLLRAALLRDFAPVIPTAQRPQPASEEEPSAEEVGEKGEEGLTAANDLAGNAADAISSLPEEPPQDVDSLMGMFESMGEEPADEARGEDGPRTPAGDVRRVLLRRLQNHPRLTCANIILAGTDRDDADGDGRSELYGDCDDTTAEFVPSAGPQLYLVFDLQDGRTPAPPGYARNPYLTLSRPRLSGAVMGISTVRDSDDAVTARHVLPDHRPLVQPGGRWARRRVTEFTMGIEGGWSPVDVLAAKCDPDYDGPPSVTCVRNSDNELLTNNTFVDFSRTGLHGAVQLMATTWDSRQQRSGFDFGAELGLNLTLPGAWATSTLQRVPLLRPRVAMILGVRSLLLPPLRTPPGAAPWGGTRGSSSGRFSRGVFSLHAGWSVTTLPEVIEGGPLLHLTLGPAMRSAAGRYAATTPYRPRAALSVFMRTDAAFKLSVLEPRLTALEYRVTATFGVNVAFAAGAKQAKEPTEPDTSGFQKIRDLVNQPPSLPGGN